MNTIIIRRTAFGYHGVIAGQHYAFSDPQMYLECAHMMWPTLLFRIEIV